MQEMGLKGLKFSKLYFVISSFSGLLLILLSWNAISKEALAKTTPDNPPIVNINTNPNANSIVGVKCRDPP